MTWVDGYRPDCPVCARATTAISEGWRQVEVVQVGQVGQPRRIERHLVAFASPCGCRLDDEQSLSMQRAAVASGGAQL